jgi:hypothetical protein
MSDNTKNILRVIGMIILAWIAWRVVVGITLLALKIAVPVLIIAGIGYAIYRANGGKSLTGGRRTLP